MNRNLNPEEKERIRDKYEEHIYFRLVNQSCKKYERELRVFRFSPEDVFVETLNVLDDLKAPNRNNNDLCDTIWDDLYCDFRERGENLPEEELDMAVTVVLSMVSYCLMLFDSMRYNGLNGKLCLLICQHYNHLTDMQQDIHQYALKVGMKELKDWITEYMQCDTYLSEEVEDGLSEEEVETSIITKTSPVYLSSKRGKKIDFIRVMNVLYELGFFQNAQGDTLTKKELFTTLAKFVNVKELEDYDKDLSRSLSDNTALDKHLKIFELMSEKMEEIFNSK